MFITDLRDKATQIAVQESQGTPNKCFDTTTKVFPILHRPHVHGCKGHGSPLGCMS